MNPEPRKRLFPLPKERLSVRSKYVTIAAGFTCKDGIVICADREESSGTSKKSVPKLANINTDSWNMTIALAGSAPAGDLIVKRLQWALMYAFIDTGPDGRGLERKHEQLIIDALTKLHEEHIWKNPRVDHSIKLIIGLSFTKLHKQYLYVTEDNIPQPIDSYCCVGYGADLCTYFAERLYHSRLTVSETILLAAFICREVNSAVQYCGKGTDMVLIRPADPAIYIGPPGVEAIQRDIPEFAKVMTTFWDSTTQLRDWLTSIGKVSERVPEQNDIKKKAEEEQQQN